jgi:hypothetical protein
MNTENFKLIEPTHIPDQLLQSSVLRDEAPKLFARLCGRSNQVLLPFKVQTQLATGYWDAATNKFKLTYCVGEPPLSLRGYSAKTVLDAAASIDPPHSRLASQSEADYFLVNLAFRLCKEGAAVDDAWYAVFMQPLPAWNRTGTGYAQIGGFYDIYPDRYLIAAKGKVIRNILNETKKQKKVPLYPLVVCDPM